MNDIDSMKEDQIAVEAVQEPTEVSEKPQDDVTQDKPPMIFDDEPLPQDFPITYEVTPQIDDVNNPKSLVYFKIHLFGPDNADLGEQTLVQDLQGIDDGLDHVGQVLAERSALILYNSDQYQKLLKVAPKRKDDPQALDLDPIIQKVDDQTAQIGARQNLLEQALQQRQEATDRTHDQDVEQLRQQLQVLHDMLVDIQQTQRVVTDWLSQLHQALTT